MPRPKTIRRTKRIPQKKRGQQEDIEQSLLLRWAKAAYPDILFKTDVSTGIKLSAKQAAKIYAQRHPRKGWPDIEVKAMRMGFGGLFIELKQTGEQVLKKDGTFKASDHLRSQREAHNKLLEAGYAAGFVIGLENGKRAVKAYLSGNLEALSKVLITEVNIKEYEI